MKIIRKNESIYIEKDEGVKVNYYLFDEYEVHYDEQLPHTCQVWHHHDAVFETILVLEGELVAEWREDGELKKDKVGPGDLVEVGEMSHTFCNETEGIVKYIVVKQILSGQNKREILKNDKVVDE